MRKIKMTKEQKNAKKESLQKEKDKRKCLKCGYSLYKTAKKENKILQKVACRQCGEIREIGKTNKTDKTVEKVENEV